MEKHETEIQNSIRIKLSEIGIVRRNNVGTFYTFDGRPIAIGIPGEADLTLFQNGGKTVFIETKTRTGRQSKKQKRFQAAVCEIRRRLQHLRQKPQSRRKSNGKLREVLGGYIEADG